jgi:surfeit locus 1 family protein
MAQQPYSPANPRARYIRSALATLILVLLLLVFVSAGIWQLGRAGEKYDLKAAFSAGSITAVLEQLVKDSEADEHRFRRFELQGRYDPHHQILLDSIVEGGRIGYQVLTPFHTDGRTVMVNRGWVQASADRSILPVIDVSGELRTITVRLNHFPVPGMRLDAPADNPDVWPQRMLFPVRDQIAAVLDEPVADYQLLLEADQPDGYLRDWRAVDVGPERHYGYAFQWFAFAIMALVIFFLLNVRWNRQHRKPSQTDTTND